ncbi:MAG: alcohol dehydrogenase catalytic domain-containing protein [Bryobacterales bacterium]|nr:alcohol dehydrogenase catalytic domain-containing protein [Bryobacterales bacterium]
MRAIVKTAPGEGHIELRDWPEPTRRWGEVKIRVAAVGICGTDIHILHGTWRCDPPVVLGHEWCGTVVETGPGATHLKPGDRVVASNPAITCGRCFHCLAGNDFMCADRVSAGYMIDGALAEFICIDAKRCHHLPDHVTFQQACIGEPLSVAVHAVIERTMVHSGDLVLVSGPGSVGLLTMQVARLEGARVVVAGLARDAARLQCARRLGAEVVVNVEEQDLLEVVRDLSGGRGVDLVYECAGSEDSLAGCWEAVRGEGTLCVLGVHPGPIRTDFNKIMMKELRVIGSYGYIWSTWQRTVQLLSERKIDADQMISHIFPMEEYEAAFRVTQNGSGIKVVLNPGLLQATTRA